MEDLFEQLFAICRRITLSKAGALPRPVTIHLQGRGKFKPPAPTAPIDLGELNAGRKPQAGVTEPRHGPEFRTLVWPGAGAFAFGTKQAAAVRLLYEGWRSGSPDVADADLLRAADSDGRLCDLFRGNAAWGKLIVAGLGPQTHRLVPLPGEAAP